MADWCDSYLILWKDKICSHVRRHIFRSGVCISPHGRNFQGHHLALFFAFAMLRVAALIKTDNGPVYTSHNLRDFFNQWVVRYNTTHSSTDPIRLLRESLISSREEQRLCLLFRGSVRLCRLLISKMVLPQSQIPRHCSSRTQKHNKYHGLSLWLPRGGSVPVCPHHLAPNGSQQYWKPYWFI